jgi:hypothetical protein
VNQTAPRGTGRYLFAVARGLDGAGLAGHAGLRGAPLEVVTHEDLQAVVCDVDLAEFGAEALATNLEDLDWLEEVARAHNDVVWRAAEEATVAPMRLVTICADDQSVRARIEVLRQDLNDVLDRVEGRREWSLKVLAPRAEEPHPVAATTGPTSGADYLRRKREAAARRRSAGDEVERAAEEIHAAAVERSVAARRLPPQDPRLTGRAEAMALNCAYLVADEESDDFVAAVRNEGRNHPQVSVEVEGPWPPYSFAVLE